MAINGSTSVRPLCRRRRPLPVMAGVGKASTASVPSSTWLRNRSFKRLDDHIADVRGLPRGDGDERGNAQHQQQAAQNE